jgi:glutamate dehydrogenase
LRERRNALGRFVIVERGMTSGDGDLNNRAKGGSPPQRSASIAHIDAPRASSVLAAAAKIVGEEDPGLENYFSAFMRYAIPEDIEAFNATELAALVKYVYECAKARKPGEPFIKILDLADAGVARSWTALIAINEDMPFLFDSCAAEVRARNLDVRAAFHPIVPREPDGNASEANESTIVLLLEKISDSEQRDGLCEEIRKVFSDVRVAVLDWRPMLTRLRDTIAELKKHPPVIPEKQLSECLAFLAWLADNHFTFLGARDYVFDGAGDGHLSPDFNSGIGLLTDPEMRVIRRGADRSSLTPDVRDFLTNPVPLIITKSNTRSVVHRRVFMDYIGVKRFDENGYLIGERRFVGLFTSTAYSQFPPEIPLLRLKVATVLARSGLPADSHDGKALAHIVNTYPRDELYQVNVDELLATSLGILSLTQRSKVRVFLRFDRFDRFVSALVYVPRERYRTTIREKIHALLADALGGRMSSATPSLEHETLARVHFIVGRNPGPRPEVDVQALEAKIRNLIRTWEDEFTERLFAKYGEAEGITIQRRYEGAFPPSYQDILSPGESVEDIRYIDTLLEGNAPGGTCLADVYKDKDGNGDGDKNYLRLMLFALDDYVSLSDCLPLFENLGLNVIAEESFLLNPCSKDGKKQRIALMNFLTEPKNNGPEESFQRIKQRLEDAFHAVWLGKAESDGFNQLSLATQLSWQDVTILRAAAKFLRQAGLSFDQSYIEAALAKNAPLALLLVDLFYALHEPDAFETAERRTEAAANLRERIDAELENVPNADEDRIIRDIACVIDATLRTNFFQPDEDGGFKAALALKLDSKRLDVLPQPKPFVEIFVYSPEVEGVHLRFGPIARGGIRWSDRAQDFRTEVLGLVKAQQVKNAVIVPVGAKGGFFPKRLPDGGTREEMQRVGIGAYKIFISALLDLTDNIKPDGEIVPPENVVRHDGDDPYLVVAADKGTASFSDIANEIAVTRNFWLGDAFASGGSHGYSHKKMGITARGAWEAVKRHFRELGRDIQKEPFTCIGVGDMSGDVFGNGMLLSQKTKLIAAFDHRHIFFDPDPDPEKSWHERERLFELERSSWDDYDKNLISAGGGVVPLSAKKVQLTPEMKALTGLEADEVRPAELINALLKAPTDLLFFGGIGTFIKASKESNSDVGDRANDFVRVDGREVRASVIGEGANLGATQLGRIEYARKGGSHGEGGRVNTDAIDNSAGVDMSDHEVNLKILLSAPLRGGALTQDERDGFLAAMGEDVAKLVLQNNYDQTLAISVSEHRAKHDVQASGRFMRDLEREGKLQRALERLPDDEALRERAESRSGLCRPEIAVLLSYAKLDLLQEITESRLPDEPYFSNLLEDYFPLRATERFAQELNTHRLKREIIATQLVNKTINLAGPFFVSRLCEISGAPSSRAVQAFAVADGAFELTQLKKQIDALDLKIGAQLQCEMIGEISDFLRRVCGRFITDLDLDTSFGETVERHRRGAQELRELLEAIVSPLEAEGIEARRQALSEAGVPEKLAREIAILPLFSAVSEIVTLVQASGRSFAAAAGAYFKIGEVVGLDHLKAQIASTASAEHWDRLALLQISGDLRNAQRILAGKALSDAHVATSATADEGASAAQSWAAARSEALDPVRSFLEDVEQGGTPSIGKFTLAASQIEKLANESS